MSNLISKAFQTIGNNSGPQGTGLAVKKSGNRMYDDLFAANPYVGLTYNKSPWQTFLSGIGFRTDYDRWLEEAQVNAAEYDAQVASIQQQNEYNSPANQAALMRQAGQNPDLLGTQGVSDSASPVQDVNGMSPGQSESGEFGELTQKIWNFGTGILRMYQLGIGLSKDMLTMKQMKNAVESQDVELAKGFMSFADDYFKKNLPDRPFSDKAEENNWSDRMAHWAVDFPKKMHFSKRQKRIWNQSLGDYFNSENMAKMTRDWSESAKNLTDYSRSAIQIPRADLFHQDQWKSFNIISSELGKFADDLYRTQQQTLKDVAEAGSATAKYDKKLSDARLAFRDDATGLDLPHYTAAAEGATQAARWHTATIQKSMNSTMSRICAKLEKEANDGDLLSAGLLLAMNIFRMSNMKLF